MLRAGCVCRDEGQVDVGLGHAGKLNLGLLSSLDEALGAHLVLGKVDAVLFLELLNHPVHDSLIEVIAAQVSITVGSQHFESAAGKLQDGHIEGTAAQVKDQHSLVLILVQAVSQSCSRGLVDDTEDLQASNAACVLGSLTLAVVEVSRHRDDSLGNSLTQISLSISLQLLEHHSGNLLGSIILAIHVDLVVALAHMALDGSDGAVRVGHSLTLSQLTHQTLAVLGEANYGRSNTAALRIRDNSRLAAFHHRNNGVSST